MPTRLSASSISAALPAALRSGVQVSVLSVHDRTLHLLAEDEVFSLVSPEVGNLPRGVIVDLPPRFTWKEAAIPAGAPVTGVGTSLHLGATLELDLSAAHVWQPRRSLPLTPIVPEQLRRAIGRAAAALAGSPGLGALAERLGPLAAGRLEPSAGEPALHRVAIPRIEELVRGTLQAEPPLFLSGALGLVGLGIGLTPSGDDLLTGYVGSLVLLADRVPSLAWVRQAAVELARQAAGRTTPIGETFLRCAAAGEIAESHERLLVALVRGDEAAGDSASRTLLNFGHSSGGEIALGTLLAVEAVTRIV